MASSWREWVLDRFGLKLIQEHLLDRKVPRSPWYYGDGAALLILFLVLVITGSFMALTYSPTPAGAYSSVVHITERQPLGWFVRGLHYWSAGAMIVMAWFHVFRVLAVGGYKFPREGMWLLGVLLLFCVLITAFIGYVLRGDDRGLYAFTLLLHQYEKIPLVGEGLVRLIQGGEQMGALTLTRLYSLHVVFVPLLMGLLIGGHLYLVIHHGVTSKAERTEPVDSYEKQQKLHHEEEEKGEVFHPETTAKSGGMGFIVFLIAVGLSLFLGPQPLYPEASLAEPATPQGEWWFWWYSGLIALIGHPIASWFVVLFPPLLFLTLVALPFVDRSPWRNLKKRPWMLLSIVASVAVLTYASLARWQLP